MYGAGILAVEHELAERERRKFRFYDKRASIDLISHPAFKRDDQSLVFFSIAEA